MSVNVRWILVNVRLVALMALIVAGAGCSTFHRDWKAAAARSPAAGSIEGAWTGTWLSHSNGHTGGLQAIVTKTPAGAYETRFHATFWKLFASEYTVTLAAQPSGDGVKLRGREDLGRIFLCYKLGEFTYDGTATGGEFKCTYGSKRDGGVFQMTRPDRIAP